MGELYDMNLRGRPLAYTPFCDNNREMDGYRFWKQVLLLFFYLDHLLALSFFTKIYSFGRVSGKNTYEGDLIILGKKTSYFLQIEYCFSIPFSSESNNFLPLLQCIVCC